MKFKCISKKILPDIPMYTTISKTLFDWEKSEDIWRTCKIDNVNEWSREIKTEEDEQMNDDGWGYEEKQTICYFEEGRRRGLIVFQNDVKIYQTYYKLFVEVQEK